MSIEGAPRANEMESGMRPRLDSRARAEHVGRELCDLGRRLADAHALRLERFLLRYRRALRAGDDCPGVAHRLAGRRREPSDVGEHRLRDVLGDVLRGLLLGVAADLAAHHDQLGLLVLLEELDDVDEVRARDRVAADADDRRVAEATLCQLVADLIGERARARHQADVALAEEVRRDDPDVGLARREDAGTVRADETGRVRALQVCVDPQHVVHRNALGDRDHELAAGVGGLEDRICGERRRHEDHRRVGACLCHAVVEGVEHRRALHVLAALAGRDAADQVGAVVLVVETVEAALTAGQAGDSELRVLAYEDAHRASSTTFAAASSMVCATCTFGRFASARIWRPSTSLVPSRRTTNGTFTSSWLKASIRPRATSSQRVMPPKMLNRTAFTFGSLRMTSTAEVIASAFEPPPASRKFAGSPPCWATTSSVDMTRPAPLPRMPMSPSSFTYVSPRSLAIRSCGSSSLGFVIAAVSGWRASAFPSTENFESSATTWRSFVIRSGLISTSVASSATKVS